MRDVLTATFAVRDLGGVDCSPDGGAVAWDETYHDPYDLLHSPRYTAVYSRRIAGGPTLRVTAGKQNGFYDEENPVWSPDGREIAFLSDARSKGQLQLFVARADGSGVRELNELDRGRATVELGAGWEAARFSLYRRGSSASRCACPGRA